MKVDISKLEATTRALVAKGKGILAADESLPTIEKRLKSIGVESTEAHRRAYRELLFSTPGLGGFISGVILFDETLRQNGASGEPLVGLLTGQEILPGIKVDKGTADLPGFPGEKFTQGLDGLRDRLAEYVKLGARFTKWRAVIHIGSGIPSPSCLQTNADALALFAALSQEAGLVPIVEPEVMMKGDHSLERCSEVTEATLAAVFNRLRANRVPFDGMLLKPSMVLPGEDCPKQA
ncbi:MAG TPA: class I fructose-bisphosphate aldolase, partial [Methylomirabilota bacterium]|nr:class I fructose-bisphosphate aldolase [Methylomirabilota bacterium]